jgi:NADH-quinone oxidoreductase subunit M
MLRVVQKSFYGQKNERFSHLQDVSFSLGIPRLILAALLFLFGLFPSLMVDTIHTSATALIRGFPP